MVSEAEFLKVYKTIKDERNNVFRQIDTAMDFEQSNSKLQAIKAYELSLQLIENVFKIPIGIPDNLESIKTEWMEATFLIEQLKEAKSEVLQKLNFLRNSCGNLDETIATCSSVEQSSSNGIGQYKEMVNSLQRMLADKDSTVQLISRFDAKVKLYRVKANGEVQNLQGPTTMSLVQCRADGKWRHLDNKFFIQCSMSSEDTKIISWIYPLLVHVTFCYRTDFGAFVFPDMETHEEGAAFGILICDSNHTQEERFANLIKLIINGNKITFEASPADYGSATVANHIVNTADVIAQNIVKGAQKTGELLFRATPYVISKIQSAPVKPTNVPPSVNTTVRVARSATGAAVGVTRTMAGAVGTASVALGRFLAPHVLYYGSNLLQKAGLREQEAQEQMANTFTLVAGAVQSVSTVMDGVEKAAAILGNSISENSVKIIEHKYGSSVGTVAAGTFETLGNAFLVSRNVNYVLPKGIAKKMLKNTGKVVVNEYLNNTQEQEAHTSQPHTLPPNIYPELKHLE